MKRPKVATLAVLLVLATLGLAQADPWPDYASHTDCVSYVQILPLNTSGTFWNYCATVLSGAYELEHGGFAGIKAVVIFPNGGSPEPALDAWTGDSAYVRPNWDTNGGWHTQQGAFGYRTTAPMYYIKPGQSNELAGTAQFPAAYVPPSQVFLVHVACNDGYTYWARPVPEPSSAAGLAGGAIVLLGLIRRRRR